MSIILQKHGALLYFILNVLEALDVKFKVTGLKDEKNTKASELCKNVKNAISKHL
jgi:hypothetical protein